MTILTSSASLTHKAQIRTAPENGFHRIYSGTCTESEAAAARNLVRKWFGDAAAETVREVRDPAEIAALVPPGFSRDPKRKQVFAVYTFLPAKTGPR